MMNVEQKNRLLEKCLEIYARKKWLLPAYQFLERLESRDDVKENLTTLFWEELLMPAIKERHFPEESIDTLLEKSILLYRSIPDKADALVRIWHEVEWKYPFNVESYDDYVMRLEQLLANESNPPSKSDWDYLDDCLIK